MSGLPPAKIESIMMKLKAKMVDDGKVMIVVMHTPSLHWKDFYTHKVFANDPIDNYHSLTVEQ